MKNPAMFLEQYGLIFQEYSIPSDDGTVGWHTTAVKSGTPIASGFGLDKKQSRKVCVAESFERLKCKELALQPLETQKKWGIDILPTGCGFAAGFSERNTIIRSIGEAIERWTLSQWIDNQLYIERCNSKDTLSSLDSISKEYLKKFSDYQFYKKSVLVKFNDNFLIFNICVTLCMTVDGIFLGSAHSLDPTTNWQHAIIESTRHLRISLSEKISDKFPHNRIFYFSNNKKLGISLIPQTENNKKWPLPSIKLFNLEYFSNFETYLARTIIDGWKSWHLGSENRFLY